jgi:hypothetical protein
MLCVVWDWPFSTDCAMDLVKFANCMRTVGRVWIIQGLSYSASPSCFCTLQLQPLPYYFLPYVSHASQKLGLKSLSVKNIYFLGYGTRYCGRNWLAFQRDVLLLSSWLKSKSSKQWGESFSLSRISPGVKRSHRLMDWSGWKSICCFFFGLLFDPKDLGRTFLWDVSEFVQKYMVSHPRI